MDTGLIQSLGKSSIHQEHHIRDSRLQTKYLQPCSLFQAIKHFFPHLNSFLSTEERKKTKYLSTDIYLFQVMKHLTLILVKCQPHQHHEMVIFSRSVQHQNGDISINGCIAFRTSWPLDLWNSGSQAHIFSVLLQISSKTLFFFVKTPSYSGVSYLLSNLKPCTGHKGNPVSVRLAC